MDITGRKLFVRALQEEGVDTIFGYPGGMVTDVMDELYKQQDIRLVLPRHEQALIHEAEGYAKSTGKVGVCLVTSGPGATNTITGLADAHYDNIPLVSARVLYRAGAAWPDRQRCVPGGRYRRHDQEHYQIRRNRPQPQGTGENY